jgi:AcrR family transcriptional regulator
VSANQPSDTQRLPRADARRNRQQLLHVARDVFVERGSTAPLDQIAKRAGVGIGTLYRHFADRETLMRAVVLDALAQSADAGERALAEASDAFGSLTTYMHAVLDLRVAAVIPVLLEQVELEGEELTAARERGARALQQIVDSAHAADCLNSEVTFGDIGLMLIRLSRPLPGRIAPELTAELAHRHLDLLINGLRPATAAPTALGGPGLSLADLREFEPEPD